MNTGSNNATGHTVNFMCFATAQRQRAEALLLVRLLFPLSDTGPVKALADWVAEGSPKDDGSRS